MKKELIITFLVVLILGCTSNNPQLEENNHYDTQPNALLSEEYVLVTQASDLPGLASINPEPGSSNFSVTGIISMDFMEDWGYSNFYLGLYERSTMDSVSFDTTSYDSFYAKDFGIVTMIALKPFTEYVLRMESINDGTVYYIPYITGEADITKPYVDYAITSGQQLEIFFSERINTSTINPENVIVTGKTGDFSDLRVSSHYMSQNVYIEFNLSYYENYEVIINNVKDLAGNMMEPETISITART